MLLKCKMCGGNLGALDNSGVAVCEYCGTKQTITKTTNENVSNLYNRANNLRLKNEFDKALSVYEKIVEQDDSEAEAHWGIILCKYGVEYVDDPKTGKKIPTCHRTSFDSVKTDIDYQSAIDYASPQQQLLYEEEAREIDRIQREILNIVKNEKPFDVFICYKETDENGERTIDSVIANDIYHQLTQEGFKVFYAAITLEDKLGQEYEPYIFAALNSAKVMLSIGTRPEYFNSVWVKNEWSRFLNLAKKDSTKYLIPCYRDMDAYDLPEEFSRLQAQDMSRIGFINDVIRGIKKLFNKDKIYSKEEQIDKETETKASIQTILKRAYIFLGDKDFGSANEYFDRVLDSDPENGQAYYGKLLIDYQITNKNELIKVSTDFSNNKNYVKAIMFLPEELKKDIVTAEQRIIFQKYLFLLNIAIKNRMNNIIKQISIFAFSHLDLEGEELLERLRQEKKTLQSKNQNLERNISKHLENDWGHNKQKITDELIKKRDLLIGEQDNLGFLQTKRKKQIDEEINQIDEIINTLHMIEENEEQLRMYDSCLTQNVGTTTGNIDVLSETYKILSEKEFLYFGQYNLENITNYHRWRILEKKDNKILVLLESCHKTMPYAENPNAYWDESIIREWLNNEFIKTEFLDFESATIENTVISIEGTNKQVDDKIFLLSELEVEKYLKDENERIAYSVFDKKPFRWWLRTINNKNNYAMYIDSVGKLRTEGTALNYLEGNSVRPAMWISFELLKGE